MDLGLKGKRALVLGASRGLGHGIAAELAAEGAELIIASRDAAAIGDAAGNLAAAHAVTVDGLVCDTGDAAHVDALADAALARFGVVDILINNTGGPPSGPISAVTMDTWQAMFERIVLGIIRLSGHLLPGMREQRWGRIITITSSGVKQPIPQLGISNSLRAAVVNWSKTLSFEIAADNVTTNVMMPGRIKTQRSAEFNAANAERLGIPVAEAEAMANARIPAGRVGTVEEFAALGAFLASERASYITGASIAVDGGAMAGV